MSARHIKFHRAPNGTAAHLRDKFYVVTMVSNPRRFRTRFELYNDFDRRISDEAGVPLYTAEVAYGNRAFAITDAANPRHIQVRTKHELWLKECALGIAISRLPQDWEYVAIIDADVAFVRPDWVNETIQMAQIHPVVQMFSHAQDLGPHYEVLTTRESFGYSYCNGAVLPQRPSHGPRHPHGHDNSPCVCPPVGYYGDGAGGAGSAGFHPGYAWCFRRDALDALGGLIDWAIVGAGDYHQAWSLIGCADFSLHPKMSGSYRAKVKEWEARAERYIHRDIGYVDGTLLHFFHGAKRDRDYWGRWKIIVDNGFDPDTDIKRDTNGVYQLQEPRTERERRLRDGLRSYFTARDEDNPNV